MIALDIGAKTTCTLSGSEERQNGHSKTSHVIS